MARDAIARRRRAPATPDKLSALDRAELCGRRFPVLAILMQLDHVDIHNHLVLGLAVLRRSHIPGDDPKGRDGTVRAGIALENEDLVAALRFLGEDEAFGRTNGPAEQ